MLLLNSVFDFALCSLQLLFRYQKLERTVWDRIESDDRCRSMELEPIARDSAPEHGRPHPDQRDTAPATTRSRIVAITRSPIPASAASAISGAALLCSALIARQTVPLRDCFAPQPIPSVEKSRAKPERLLHTCYKSRIRARFCFRRQDKT
jgi:hypothetical protein